jgi:hypothetical protein
MNPKKIPPFDAKRWPLGSTTLARQVTRQHLGVLNDAFWVTEHSHSAVKTIYPSLTLPSGIGAHGCFGSEVQWVTAVNEQRLWVRQHVLVSAASLLEVYLASAASAALWANPEFADRSLNGVREVELIKFAIRFPELEKIIRTHVNAILKGTWRDRMRRMAIVFGKLPPKLEALVPILQGIQDKRNKIAHAFGRSSKEFRRTPWEPTDRIRLEVPEVESALKTVGAAVREADLHLFGNLIGGYEFLYEYHAWLNGFKDSFSRPEPGLREPEFRKHIAAKFGHGPSKPYYLSMIRYYEACK